MSHSKCNSFKVTSNLLNSDSLKVAITRLCNELQVYDFSYVIADQKVAEKRIYTKYLNTIIFELQVILLVMEGTEKSESSHYSLSYLDRHPSCPPRCSYGKK